MYFRILKKIATSGFQNVINFVVVMPENWYSFYGTRLSVTKYSVDNDCAKFTGLYEFHSRLSLPNIDK